MRIIRRLFAGVCLAALLVTMVMPAGVRAEEETPDSASAQAVSGSGLTIMSKDNRVPTFEAGKATTWILIVHNNSGADLNNAVLSPSMGEKNEEWPFISEYQSYSKELNIKAGESQEVSFEFTQREDVATSRHTLQFNVYTQGIPEAVVSQKFYANTTAKPIEKQEPPANNTPVQNPDAGGQLTGGGMDLLSAEAGGFSNGGASFSGGGGSGQEGSASVPRVIVTGFTTDPAEVRAGSNFVLTIHLKNTSKSTRVRNMLFDLSAPTEGSDAQTVAPAFLPASGSSSIYLEGINADGAADISIQLNAKADLLQKPYSVELSMKYEDKDGAQIDAASSISIPVKQDARFEFSDFEISPESISVGDEANVMCSLYNLGRIKLYNVKATFEGACIKKEEVFLGNVESGATGSIDAMLEGAQATEGPANVTMTVSYEDEAGKISTTTKELQIEVMDMMEDASMMSGMEMPEEEKGFPVIPAAVIAGIAVIIIIIVVVRKKRKKRQRLNEEEELLDELDRSSEDER